MSIVDRLKSSLKTRYCSLWQEKERKKMTHQKQFYYVCYCLVPAAGFTQRATMDPDTDEIHVLSVSILTHF